MFMITKNRMNVCSIYLRSTFLTSLSTLLLNTIVLLLAVHWLLGIFFLHMPTFMRRRTDQNQTSPKDRDRPFFFFVRLLTRGINNQQLLCLSRAENMGDVKSTTYNLSTDEEQQCGEPTSTTSTQDCGENNLDHYFRDLRLGTGMAHEVGFTLDAVSDLYAHPWYGHFPQFCEDELPSKPNMLRNMDDDVYQSFVNDLAQSKRDQSKFFIFFFSLLTAFLIFSLAAEFCPDDYHDLLSYVGVAFLCLACLSIFLLLCKRLQLDPRYVVEKHHGHFFIKVSSWSTWNINFSLESVTFLLHTLCSLRRCQNT